MIAVGTWVFAYLSAKYDEMLHIPKPDGGIFILVLHNGLII